ncbi:M48 family metalloprotease [Cesiribacter andamanensis]|uniref:Putative metalloprotease yggG n=1 Tax=Cesiribacter andamanensis AMV16 TaxID=1279009 RepID=M7N5G4_9BACT|nr:M48 family metalloprotease [Cesiribacter andamanensis]EMR02532.1 putative metalloprotease yggG [Cesiribacter andamanensis AMV16]
MKHPFYSLVPVIALFVALLSSCSKDEPFVLFPLEQDVALGAEVHQEILNMPDSLPILSQEQYPQAYQYLSSMMDRITASPDVLYKDRFGYTNVFIIRNDEELNAFATPGGYIYVYTGLIKYLETEDHLAGVLAHEIAHADRRHTVRAIQREVGLQLLLDVALGERQGAVVQVARALGNLQYSRSNEEEADQYSVRYLSNPQSPYACDGAAGFFEKLLAEGGTDGPPQFLSTHPSPANRVEDIQAEAQSLGCDADPCSTCSYQQFKNMLP